MKAAKGSTPAFPTLSPPLLLLLLSALILSLVMPPLLPTAVSLPTPRLARHAMFEAPSLGRRTSLARAPAADGDESDDLSVFQNDGKKPGAGAGKKPAGGPKKAGGKRLFTTPLRTARDEGKRLDTAAPKDAAAGGALPPAPPKLSAALLHPKDFFMTRLELIEVMRLIPGPRRRRPRSLSRTIARMFEKAFVGGRKHRKHKKKPQYEHVHVHYYIRGPEARRVVKRVAGVKRLLTKPRLARVYSLATGKGKGECVAICSGVDYRACADCAYRHLTEQLATRHKAYEQKQDRYIKALVDGPQAVVRDTYRNPPVRAGRNAPEAFE
ncbi:hypothetical protein HDU96_006162 [Phlyctochytrium bullatum]|nr:hypothetical protein HDU96_006162 [Phlyctochytrium bullatum]